MARSRLPIRHLALGILAAAAVGSSPSNAATTRVVAWGDSITYGYYDGTSASSDCSRDYPDADAPEVCGYPGRLGSRLNDAAEFSPVYDVELLNLGRGGEKTPQALSRMDRVTWPCPCENLDPGCGINSLKYWYCNGTLQPEDLLVLMEGTNDVTQQDISLETVSANLQLLGQKAEALGLNVVISTLTPRHPGAWTRIDQCADDGDADVVTLNGRIATIAATKGWPKADPYGRLKAGDISGLFTYYYQSWEPMRCDGDVVVSGGDPVGHPSRYGFDAIACNGTKTTACTTSGTHYPKTFESVVRGALPPRLALTTPTPPLTSGVSLPFSATLHDVATFAQTVELTWDFGDGTVETQSVSSSPVARNHTYWSGGSFTVTVTAKHPNGGTRATGAGVSVSLGTPIFVDGFESGGTSNWIVGTD